MKMKNLLLLISLAILIGTLSGCVELDALAKTEDDDSISTDVDEKEFTLKLEKVLKGKGGSKGYRFTGFIGEKTFTLSSLDYTGAGVSEGYVAQNLYLPLQIGHTFELTEFKGIQFTLIDFDISKNYIKLKGTKVK